MKRKIISLLTVICMVLGIMPQIAFGMSGSGTADDPYQIDTADDLFSFASKVNGGAYGAWAVLTADINLDNRKWTPIGTKDHPFTGTFDGRGYKISGLYINVYADYYQGLFGYTGGGAVVKNVNVEGSIKGYRYAGGVVGYNEGTVTGCSFGGTVYGTERLGGIAGQSAGTVKNCYNTGTIGKDTTDNDWSHDVGGIVGYIINYDMNKVTVENCYNTGTIKGKYSAGSVVGSDSVKNCYYLEGGAGGKGTAKTAEAFASGEVAMLLQGSQTEEVWGQKIGTDKSPVIGGPKVYKTQCTKNQYSNVNYSGHDYVNGVCSHCGDTANLTQTSGVYQIGTAEQLMAFASIVNGGEKGAKAVLTADIDLQDRPWTTMCETGLYWKEYGTDMGFTGTFDGQGHTIKNLALENSTAADATCGLFGTVSGEVKNLGIENVTFNIVGGMDFRVGAIAGQLIKSTGRISNCRAANVTIPENHRVAGGIAGCAYEGTIENCLVYGSDIHGSHPTNVYRYGYIVGDTRGDNSTSDRKGIVKNCYTDGSRACGTQSGTISGCEDNIQADRFSSGEIAYKLQGTQSTQIWGQTLYSDKPDSYPRLNGPKVYSSKCVNGTACYGNQSSYAYHFYINGVCSRCGYKASVTQTDGVYQIANADQLMAFASLVNSGSKDANAVMTADISVSTEDGFVPIGTDSNRFAGSFDGGNHTLTLNLTGGENTAPFAFADNATIKNLTTAGTINASGKYAAGFVSQLWTGITLERCISKMVIDSTVSGDGTHGGLIGVANSGAKNTVINNCAFIGAINGSDTHSCGGMVGWTNEKGHTTIKNSYVACSFTIGTDSCDTFSRNPKYVTLDNCYYLTALGNGGATQLTAAQFESGKAAVLLQDEQTEHVWGQTLGTDKYPLIGGKRLYPTYNGCDIDPDGYSNTETYPQHKLDADNICTVCGRFIPVDGVYKIGNAKQLMAFAGLVNGGEKDAKAVLTADISVFTADGFVPVGTAENKFAGSFDGGNHTLTLDLTGGENTAPFAFVENATIKNLTTAGTITASGKFAAGFVGQVENGITLERCISKVAITSTVSGDGTHGGLISVANSGQTTIENCAFLGAINGSGTTSCGGLVGWTNGTTTIKNSYVACSFTIGTDGCDTFGRNQSKVTLTNCYYLTALGGVSGGAAQLTAAQFESGEAAILLQGSQTEQVWGQKLAEDKYPLISGDKVYIKYTDCTNKTYTNNKSEEQVSPLDHSCTDNICTVCGRLVPVDGVYKIGNAEQLMAFAKTVEKGAKDANAVLTADIDMTGQSWTTICETGLYHKGYGEDLGYAGTFDGQGFTISNLKLQSSTEIDSSCGLFGTVSGTVKNLTIDGVTLTDGGKDMRTGAVAGQLVTTNGHIINCCVKNASITPGEHVVGGIAGCVYEGTVENCLVYGSQFSGTDGRFGHIVGDTRGDINETDRFGIVKNCYTDGSSVNGGQQGTIENCETVTAQKLESGEIAFLLQGSQSETVWGQTIGTELYPSLKGMAVYKNTCVDNIYYGNTEETYTEHEYKNDECIRCGAALDITIVDGVYQIKNAAQMKQFADKVNGGEYGAKGVLMNDIDLSAECGENIGSWTPIGTKSDPFTGTFDGGGHKISGLYIDSSSAYQGLFGYISKPAEVKSLNVEGSVKGSEYIGGVVGGNGQGTVTGCSFSGTVTGSSYSSYYVGGVIGYCYNGTVENCYNTGTVNSTGDDIGGVIGFCYQNTIVKNCYNTGTVTGDDRVGGVVGYAFIYPGTVENCYNTGAVTGDKYVGGVVGQQDSAKIKNCYYKEGSASGGINGSDTAGQAEVKTAEEFASGEVAMLLQGSQTNQVWGQALSGEVKDEYPVVTSDPAKKVYKVTYINGDTTEEEYTNKVLILRPAPAENTCWTKENGEAAKDGEELTADITLYAKNAYTVTVNGGLIGSETSAVVAEGQSVTITPDKAIAGFVADDGSLVLPNENGEIIYTVKKDVILTGKSLGISLLNGAQVRVGAGLDAEGKITVTDGLDGSGLRFVGEIDRNETLASYMGENDKIYVAVTAEGSDKTVRIPIELYQSDSVFTAALVNLKVANYNRVFTARVEAEINGSVVVGNEVSRSVYEVSAGLLTEDAESEVTKTISDVLNAYVNQVGIRLSIQGDSVTADSAYTGKVFFDVTSEKDANGVYTITITPLGQAKTADYWNDYIRINNNNSEAKKHVTAQTSENGSLVITFDPKKTN